MARGEKRSALVASRLEMWRGRVEAWRSSGLSQGAFCREQRISPSALSYWKRRLLLQPSRLSARLPRPLSTHSEKVSVGEASQVRWAEVFLPAGGSVTVDRGAAGLELVLPNGWSVRVGREFEEATLERLLSALESRTC